MKIIERPDLARKFIRDADARHQRPHEYEPTQAGITTLIDCLAKQQHIHWGDESYMEELPNARLYAMMGTNYHGVFMPEQESPSGIPYHIDVRLADGRMGRIRGYKDGETGRAGVIVPQEFKTTAAYAMSGPKGQKTKTVPNSHYIEQLAETVYAAAIAPYYDEGDSPYSAEGDLIIVYRPTPPVLRYYTIEFSGVELVDWHQELVRRLGLYAQKTEAPIEEHADWNCNYFCPRKGLYCHGPKGKWVSPFEAKAEEIMVLDLEEDL